jgi:hypothetical protein
LFFWAFVASAFAGFGSVYERSPDLALIVAGFGAVCSAAWTLANRGSKYWQQTWEARVEELAGSVTGPLFNIDSPVQTDAILWLRARRFSVSKLTIALSDFVAFLWVLLALGQVLRMLGLQSELLECSKVGSLAFFFIVCAYICILAIFCRTSKRGSPKAG